MSKDALELYHFYETLQLCCTELTFFMKFCNLLHT